MEGATTTRARASRATLARTICTARARAMGLPLPLASNSFTRVRGASRGAGRPLLREEAGEEVEEGEEGGEVGERGQG